jgi:hypothetical protein
MNKTPYPFARVAERYVFTSKGNQEIIKAVEFTPVLGLSLFNLCLGDVMPDNCINDVVVSNNGDMKKVFATVIQIVIDFFKRNPDAEIIFFGNSNVHTYLYARILSTYYKQLTNSFSMGLIRAADKVIRTNFDPKRKEEYIGFSIQRIN